MAAADTASEYDSCGHRRCWTAAASCPYYSCRRRAKPVGLVLPCEYCSRTRCCALWFVDDDGRALFCRAIHKPFSIIFVVAEMTSTLTTSATSRQCIILHYVRNCCMPETRNLSSSSTWWVRWTGPLYSWTTRASSIETLFALF